MRAAHADLTVVDGLQYSNWDRAIFAEIAHGGIASMHATIAIWEGARAALSVIGFWNRMFREHADILMPGRGGDEILAELKQDPGTSGIPVIVLSVVEPAELPSSADAHLAKPVRQEALLRALARHDAASPEPA